MKPSSFRSWACTAGAVLLLLPAPALRAEEAAPAGTPASQREVESGVAPVPAGRSRFWQRLSSYEPTYFLLEPVPPSGRHFNAKMQLSFAFQLIGDPHLVIEQGDERADGLYGAYSQTSFWDLQADSKPFLDTSYRPEGFWHQGFTHGLLGSDGLAGEVGVSHESNGKAADDQTRSYNTAFIRPLVRWDMPDGWWLRAAPRFQLYLGPLDENPQVDKYRGIGTFDVAIGVRDGALLALSTHLSERPSLQADLSYPADRLTAGWMHGYLYAQYYWGWSESLIAYDQLVEQPRFLIGFALTR